MSKIHKPLCHSFVQVYFGLFKHVGQIYCVCANNHLQLKSSQLGHEAAGSHRIYRECTLHIFILVKRDFTVLFSLTELQNSEFKEYKISKSSSIVCIFAYAYVSKINHPGIVLQILHLPGCK